MPSRAPPAKSSRSTLYVAAAFAGVFLPLFVNGWYNPIVRSSATSYWAVEILTWVVLPAVLLWALFRSEAVTAPDLGLHGLVRGRDDGPLLIEYAVLWSFAMYFLYVAGSAFANAHLPDFWKVRFDYSLAMPKDGPARVAVALFFSLSAGIIEEIWFRGMLRRLLGSGVVFVIVSAAFFGLIHWELGTRQLFATTLWGLVAALVYLRIGNLLPLIAAHAATDFVDFYLN